MTTLLKIRGLDRVSTGNTTPLTSRGFRVRQGFGQQFPNGTVAAEIVGTVGAPNAAVQYKVRYGGTFGNSIKVVQNTPSGATTVIATTFTASTGVVLITITPSTTDTAATVVTKVNADPQASQYVVASLVGTGASAPVASANANAVITLAQGTGTTTGGTFKLSFPGYGTTAAISGTATGAAVATAVQLVTGGTVTGSGTTLPASTTLTFTGTLASTPVPTPSVDSSLLTPASTLTATATTYGSAAAGTLNGGSNSGTGQSIEQIVNGQQTVIVDLDDAFTLRQLYRMKGRWVSLGQP